MSGNLAGRNVHKLYLIKMDICLITGKYSFLKEKTRFHLRYISQGAI